MEKLKRIIETQHTENGMIKQKRSTGDRLQQLDLEI